MIYPVSKYRHENQLHQIYSKRLPENDGLWSVEDRRYWLAIPGTSNKVHPKFIVPSDCEQTQAFCRLHNVGTPAGDLILQDKCCADTKQQKSFISLTDSSTLNFYQVPLASTKYALYYPIPLNYHPPYNHIFCPIFVPLNNGTPYPFNPELVFFSGTNEKVELLAHTTENKKFDLVIDSVGEVVYELAESLDNHTKDVVCTRFIVETLMSLEASKEFGLSNELDIRLSVGMSKDVAAECV